MVRATYSPVTTRTGAAAGALTAAGTDKLAVVSDADVSLARAAATPAGEACTPVVAAEPPVAIASDAPAAPADVL